ncbi:MAG: CoA-binding protein, partial [Candidatus Methylomirabilota bacterium]
MSILLNKSTRVLVQGITGKIGQAQTKWMKEYGTNIVAGVTPGRGGASVEGVPVFDSVADAVRETRAEASVFFVPARSVKDTVFETLEAGIRLVVVVTEHVPVHDTMEMRAAAKQSGALLLGPTTPGILTVGEA